MMCEGFEFIRSQADVSSITTLFEVDKQSSAVDKWFRIEINE